MLSQKPFIIWLKRTSLKAGHVIGGQIVDLYETAWDPDLLPKILTDLQLRYTTSAARVVLDDEVSYTLSLSLPTSIKEENERQEIASRIREQVPETIESDNWDFKLDKVVDTEKLMTVFIPVQDVYQSLSKAASLTGLHLEAVETAAVATTRDPDPMLGIAKKTDLQGRDETVLNLRPATPSETPTSPRHFPRFFRLSIMGLGVFALILLSIFLLSRLPSSKREVSVSSPAPVIPSSPTPSPTTIPSLPLASYAVQILNGSGRAGEAKLVDNLLQSEGFTLATLGNAENYDYTSTIVQLKPGLPSSVFSTIERALNSVYQVQRGDELTPTSNYDVLIRVGQPISK